jgi:peroxiredoxin
MKIVRFGFALFLALTGLPVAVRLQDQPAQESSAATQSGSTTDVTSPAALPQEPIGVTGNRVPAVSPEAADALPLNFELPTLEGNRVSVVADKTHPVTVVCFLGAECPLVKLYSPRLSAMSQEFGAQGVRFVAVNSNRQDTVEDITAYLTEHQLPFPLLRDEGNIVADRFGAERTPEVFVLDQSMAIVYQGRIDDQYAPGVNRPAASQHELRTAIERTLAGQPLKISRTEPVGCMIGKVRKKLQLPRKRSQRILRAKTPLLP